MCDQSCAFLGGGAGASPGLIHLEPSPSPRLPGNEPALAAPQSYRMYSAGRAVTGPLTDTLNPPSQEFIHSYQVSFKLIRGFGLFKGVLRVFFC